MELQEDAYRLSQILEQVDVKDIVTYLRTKVANVDREIRCQLALQHFLSLEDILAKGQENFERSFKDDLLCITHLLPWLNGEEIKYQLNILGSIPNRKQVAVRLLLHKKLNNNNGKKRKSGENDKETEVTSTKLVKTVDLNKAVPLKQNLKENWRLDPTTKNREEIDIAGKENSFKFWPPTIPSEILGNVKQEQYVKPLKNPIFCDEDNDQNGKTTEVKQSTPINEPIAGPSRCYLPKEVPIVKASPTLMVSNLVSDFNLIENSFFSPSTCLNTSEVQLLDEAAGGPSNINLTTHHKKPTNVDEKLVLKLFEMFPEAAPDYIRDVCDGKVWSEKNFDDIVTIICSADNYPRRPERLPSPEKELDPDEQLQTLKAVLPDADPTYLQTMVDKLAGDNEGFQRFIEDAMELKNYPTMKEYLRKQQISAQQRQYTTEFKVERFVELFPDPVATFEDLNRKSTILDQFDKYYVKWLMRNKYSQLYVKDVNSIAEKEGRKNIISIVKSLDNQLKVGPIKRSKVSPQLRPDIQNIPLLQELAYFEHKVEILHYIDTKKVRKEQERQNAKELGLLQTCLCCYDDEIMPGDILTCMGGCRFCRDCIRRGTEVAFGEGKIDFLCLMYPDKCSTEFTLQVLQNVLPPKLFSKLAQKKAVAEVKAAGVEDLETCRFCDFATIPAPDDRLFRCLNPDCMKESCRLCKEPSHVPLRCDEVEKDESIKARTYVENKMTEALIRECWKCGAKFIKEEGCNKMTCSCGAMMCYICRKPVTNYKHFNGQGGERHELCPLYTDNYSVNEKNVIQAAEEAKKQVDQSLLKNDPTADLETHFGSKKKYAEHLGREGQQGGMQQGRHVEMQRLRQELREQVHMLNNLERVNRAGAIVNVRVQPVEPPIANAAPFDQYVQAPPPFIPQRRQVHFEGPRNAQQENEQNNNVC